MLFNFFLGLALVGFGIVIVKFQQNIYNFTGAIDFVEQYFHAGTPAFIKIVGVVLVIFGLGMMVGLWGWLTQPFAEGVKSLSGGAIRR